MATSPMRKYNLSGMKISSVLFFAALFVVLGLIFFAPVRPWRAEYCDTHWSSAWRILRVSIAIGTRNGNLAISPRGHQHPPDTNFRRANCSLLIALKRKRLSRGASLERLVENLGPCEVSFRRRLMFLLFCLLFRCHEGSSVSDFSLAKVLSTGPNYERHPSCGAGSIVNTRYCGTVNTVST